MGLTAGAPFDEAPLIEKRLTETEFSQLGLEFTAAQREVMAATEGFLSPEDLTPEQRQSIMKRRLKILFFTETGPDEENRSPVARPLLFNPNINIRVGAVVLADGMRVMNAHFKKLLEEPMADGKSA